MQSPAGHGLRARTASTDHRRKRVTARALRIICLAVCSGSLLLAPPAHAAGARGKVAAILAKRADLDLKLQTALLDQPRWLRDTSVEQAGAAGSLRLFVTARGRQTSSESSEIRGLPTGLEARELSFPVRKVAAEHLVTRSVMLKLSVGLDRELERWSFGDITPSVGLLFERRFQ
jgi:hypothetical protein